MRTVRKFLPALLIVLAYLTGYSTDVRDQMTKEVRAQSLQDRGRGHGGRRPGHLLVKFDPYASPAEVARLSSNQGATVVGHISGIGVTHLLVPQELELTALQDLERSPVVEFAEFDEEVTVLFTPNDPYYSTRYPSTHFGQVTQWALPDVSAPAAWDTTKGTSATVIAIVDTGIDATHPDLALKVIGQQSYVGNAKDGFGHGTHVAGIAAAATNNGTGVAGACPECMILSVKVLDDNGSGSTSNVASGIVYAADAGASVISLSLGGSGHCSGSLSRNWRGVLQRHPERTGSVAREHRGGDRADLGGLRRSDSADKPAEHPWLPAAAGPACRGRTRHRRSARRRVG